MGSSSSLNSAESTTWENVCEEPVRKRKAIDRDTNDELPAMNTRVEDDTSDVQLSSIVIDDDESIEPAPAPHPKTQAAVERKMYVVFKAPLGSGRSTCGVIGKVAPMACVEMESDSDEGESDAE